MSVVRWVLVPVAAGAAWMLAVVFGVVLHGMATRMCPESQMVSGACVAPWWPIADAVVLCLSAAFAAAAVIIAAAVTAPSYRPQVAIGVFAIGAAVAVALAVAGDAYLALPCAGAAGAVAVWWTRRRYRAVP